MEKLVRDMKKKNTIYILASCILFLNLGFCKTTEELVKKDQTVVEEIKKPLFAIKDNVRLEAVDIGDADPKKDKTVYYKIYINKEILAKTPAGFFFQKKSVKLNLEEGKYLFFAERWQLEKRKDVDLPEYYRANNIWQMKAPVYLTVKQGQLMSVKFGYDHGKRKFYLNE